MKAMNIITLAFIIVGGINWGLVALFQYDLVLALLGERTAVLPQFTYLVMGLSALWQLYPLTCAFQTSGVLPHRYRV
jgi:uncharacterized protein